MASGQIIDRIEGRFGHRHAPLQLLRE